MMRAITRSGARVECAESDPHRIVWVTNRQLTIVLSLANGDRTVATVASDWPGMSYGMAYSTVQALYRKGIVEPARWGHTGREWGLSPRGRAFVAAIEAAGWGDIDESWDDDVRALEVSSC